MTKTQGNIYKSKTKCIQYEEESCLNRYTYIWHIFKLEKTYANQTAIQYVRR